jgi:hypothetical protein
MEAPDGTRQETGRALPLRTSNNTPCVAYTFYAGDFIYISAQNEGGSGTVICTIKVNGRVVANNTSDGAYTIATCSSTA